MTENDFMVSYQDLLEAEQDFLHDWLAFMTQDDEEMYTFNDEVNDDE